MMGNSVPNEIREVPHSRKKCAEFMPLTFHSVRKASHRSRKIYRFAAVWWRGFKVAMGSICALKNTWYIVSTKGEHVCMESCKIPHNVGQQKHQTDKTTERRELQACQIKDFRLSLSGLTLQMTSSDCELCWQ
jgi:hypothetical protein